MTSAAFDERVGLLAAFADRVAALPAAAWERIRARCAPLEGDSPEAIFARARLSANSHTAGIPDDSGVMLVRVITTLSHGVQTALALAGEIAFTIAPGLDEPCPPLSRSTGNATTDRFIDAKHLIDAAVRNAGPRNSGLQAALDAASTALLKRRFLTAAQFGEFYKWVEPEIPIVTLDARPAGHN